MRTVLDTNEARQATVRPRSMLWVLIISLALAVLAGFALALGWVALPWG